MEDFCLPLVDVGGLTISNLNREYTERPNINSVVILFTERDQLRGHPTNCADLRNSSSLLPCQLCGVSEIGKLHITLSVNKNIVRFDIPMNDASLVEEE